MNNSCIFIPVRLGATRLPNKPILMIGNKPMICHVIDRAKEADICEVVVATDSSEIMDIVSNYNTKCVMTSVSHESGSDRIFEALEQIDANNNLSYVINLQGDMPFIHPETIKKLHSFGQISDADINTLAVPIDKNRAQVKSVVKPVIAFNDDDWGKALYFSREMVPHNADQYFEHLGIYAYKRQSLKKFISLPHSALEISEKLEQLRALENDMTINISIVQDNPKTVDTPEDLEVAREHYKQLFL